MPGMNGVELAIQISILCPECKVLLLSGQAATSDLLQKARDDGHDFELLIKPLDPRELLSNLKRVLPQGLHAPPLEENRKSRPNPTPKAPATAAVRLRTQ
jgi:CheY-like chemotaxis protein